MSTSKKRILAATLLLVALGLGIEGYTQLTRASAAQEKHSARSSLAALKYENYRANHQSGHGSAVFAWMDAAHRYADSQSDANAQPLIDEPASSDATALEQELRAIRDEGNDHHSSRNPRQHDLIGASTLLAEYHHGGAEPWAPHGGDWTALPKDLGGTALSPPNAGLWANDPQWTNGPALGGGANPSASGEGDSSTGGNHSVPEPGTLTLFALGAAAALRRRRR